MTDAPASDARCTIVAVDPALWRRYRGLRLAALRESPRMFGSTYEREHGFDEAEWRRRAGRPATFLAERAGSDLGIAGTYEFDTGWWVMGMWVDPAARGTGMVDALMGACVHAARRHRAAQLSLLVMADNPRGIRAYERNGFALTGDRERAPDGRWELVMSRSPV